jgi:hypothetical protein
MLADNSIMQFGAHKNKLMMDVPASYLMWLYNAIKDDIINHRTITTQQKDVYDYVVDNLDVLKKELNESNNK